MKLIHCPHCNGTLWKAESETGLQPIRMICIGCGYSIQINAFSEEDPPVTPQSSNHQDDERRFEIEILRRKGRFKP